MLAKWKDRYFVRTGALAAISTIVLTAAFIGVLALLEGEVNGIAARAPWYLVLAALAFTVMIVFLERNDVSGRVIIGTAAIFAIVAFGLTTLMTEGLIYTVRNPDEVFVSQLVLYFLAAGLVGTGFGYWAIKHWREFTSPSKPAENRL